MKAVEFINEASYPGNIGMMEMWKFKQIASPEQLSIMKKLIELRKYKKAWQFLQDVTKTKLHDK